MPLSYSGLCSATLPRRTGSTIFKQLSSINKHLAIQRRSRHTPTQQHITTQPLSHHEHRGQTPLPPQMGRPHCVRSVLDAVANSMYNSMTFVVSQTQLALECRRQATSGNRMQAASHAPTGFAVLCGIVFIWWHCMNVLLFVTVCGCLWLFVIVCCCVVVCGCGCLWWCGCVGVWVLLRLAACIFEFVGAFRAF